MGRRTAGRWLALALCVALAVSACSAAEGDTTTTTERIDVDAVTTTLAVERLSPTFFLLDMIAPSYTQHGMLIRGYVENSTETGLHVRVVEVLGDWAADPGPSPGERISFSLADLPYLDAEMLSVDSAGGLPALIMTTEEGLRGITPLSDDLRRFVRDPKREVPPEIAIGTWIADSIDAGTLVGLVMPAIDSTRSLWCQDLSPTELRYAESGGDEVMSAVSFGVSLLDARSVEIRLQQLWAVADEISLAHVSEDKVTGLSTSPYNTDIYDQLARGVPTDEVEILSTVPFDLRPGKLTWLRAGGEVLLFADTETGRMLGWVDFGAYLGHGEELPSRTVYLTDPPKGDLGVFLRPLDDPFFSCTESLGEPFMVIPATSIADGRWAIVMDEQRIEPWDGPAADPGG